MRAGSSSSDSSAKKSGSGISTSFKSVGGAVRSATSLAIFFAPNSATSVIAFWMGMRYRLSGASTTPKLFSASSSAARNSASVAARFSSRSEFRCGCTAAPHWATTHTASTTVNAKAASSCAAQLGRTASVAASVDLGSWLISVAPAPRPCADRVAGRRDGQTGCG